MSSVTSPCDTGWCSAVRILEHLGAWVREPEGPNLGQRLCGDSRLGWAPPVAATPRLLLGHCVARLGCLYLPGESPMAGCWPCLPLPTRPLPPYPSCLWACPQQPSWRLLGEQGMWQSKASWWCHQPAQLWLLQQGHGGRFLCLAAVAWRPGMGSDQRPSLGRTFILGDRRPWSWAGGNCIEQASPPGRLLLTCHCHRGSPRALGGQGVAEHSTK